MLNFNILDYHVRKSDAELMQQFCSKHISDSVQLNWSLLGTEIKGTASLRGITLSSAMLSIITVAPLKWSKYSFCFVKLSTIIVILYFFLDLLTLDFLFLSDVKINGKEMPAISEISCATGQSISIYIQIENQSPTDLTDLTLSIQFYQDYQNGTSKYQLETRVALSGPNT